MKKIFPILALAVCMLTFNACNDDLGNAVPYDKFYQDLSDADRAILGVYAQFTTLAEQIVVLNELRADLVDVTSNATPELESLNQSRMDASNPWISPSKFYAVINACNDAMANFDKMLAENRMREGEYNERYSDIGALRCWIYLQLLNIYGSVPYITEPLVELEDVDKYMGQRENADQLLPKLIAFMENLPTLEDYIYSSLIENTTLSSMFISKKLVLADLYLFNNQYEQAVHYYRTVMATDETSGSLDSKRQRYRLYTYTFTSTTGEPGGWYVVQFRDGHIEDEGGLLNTWKYIFSDAYTDRNARARAAFERIWYLPFDDRLQPVNPFATLFEGYQLRASEYAMDSLWAKPMRNQFPYDARGLGSSYTGNGVIAKYSARLISGISRTHGFWMLYRAAGMHLRYAEAANRAGYPYLAWCFLNGGIRSGSRYNYTRPDGTAYPADSTFITGTSPFDPYPFEYGFDARYPNQWECNTGVRGRVYMPTINFPEGFTSLNDSILWLEHQIIREAALELAFEGQRWGDLLRIARRMNKEGRDGYNFFFNENIKKKYDLANIPPPPFTADEKSWYLPFNE